MIVVGILGTSGGTVLEIARRAAATGARTEVVGAVSVGAPGDRLLLQLAAAGVGHATVTRTIGVPADPALPAGQPAIEPADLELALRYLPEVRAIVLVAPPGALLAIGAAAASFAGATLVIVGPVDPAALDSLATPGPFVLDPPVHDPDAAFAGLVAALAVRLDAGEAPALAWATTLDALAVDVISPTDG